MKKTVKTSPWVNVLIWASVLVMVCANVFGGANIPWLLVFLPALVSLGLGLVLFGILGAVALIVIKVTNK